MSEQVTITVTIDDKASPGLAALAAAQKKTRKEADKTAKTIAKEADVIADLGRVAGGTAGKIGSMPPHLRLAGAGMEALGAGVNLASRALAELGDQAVQSVREFAKFDGAITRAAALTSDGAQNFDRMKGAAEEAGLATMFSATEAAQAMTKLAMAGQDAETQIGGVRHVLDLASIGAVSLSKAADISTNVMSSYNLTASEMSAVNDKLATTFTNSNTSLAGLGKSFEYVGAIAKSAGQDFNGILAQIGALGDLGIQGSKAGTGIRAAIASLLKPTEEGSKALRELGVSATDSEGKLKQLPVILRELRDAGATTADVLTIFGKVGGTAVQSLVSNIDKVDALRAKIDDSRGAAERMSETINSSLDARIKILSGTVDTLRSRMGEQLSPTLKTIADDLTRGAKAASENKAALALLKASGADLEPALEGLVDVASELVPITLAMGGAFLDAAKNGKELLQGAKMLASVLAPQVDSVGKLFTAYDAYNAITGKTNDELSNTVRLFRAGKEAMASFRGGLDQTSLATQGLQKGLGALKSGVGLVRAEIKGWSWDAKKQSEADAAAAAAAKRAARERAQELAKQRKARDDANAKQAAQRARSLALAQLEVKVSEASTKEAKLRAQAEVDRLRVQQSDVGSEEKRIRARMIQLRLDQQLGELADERAKKAARELEVAARQEAADRKKLTSILAQGEAMGRLGEAQRVEAEYRAQILEIEGKVKDIRDEGMRQQAQAALQEQAALERKLALEALAKRQLDDQIAGASAGLGDLSQQIGALGQQSAVMFDGLAGGVNALSVVTQEAYKTISAVSDETANAAAVAASGLAVTGKAASTFATKMGASAAASAGILAAFEAAAAVASGAAGDIPGAVAHGLAASMYAAVAGMSAGEGRGGGGGGAARGAVAGAGGMAAGSNPEAARASAERGAEILAEKLAEKLGGGGQRVYIDLRGSTVLDETGFWGMIRDTARNNGVDLEGM